MDDQLNMARIWSIGKGQSIDPWKDRWLTNGMIIEELDVVIHPALLGTRLSDLVLN